MRTSGKTYRTCLEAAKLMSEGNEVIVVTPTDYFNHHLRFLAAFLEPLTRSCVYYSQYQHRFILKFRDAQPTGATDLTSLRQLEAGCQQGAFSARDKRRTVILFDDCAPSARTETHLRAWGLRWQ